MSLNKHQCTEVSNQSKIIIQFFIFELLILLLSNSFCTAEYERITVIGETVGINGIFDPSIEYDQNGTIGWMTYSPVEWPAYVHTHLAKTTDHGETWVFVSSINVSIDGTVVSGTVTVEGVWRHEVSTLVYDADDPGKEWKLFWHKYFTATPYTGDDRDFARGWIAYKYTNDPAGTWSDEIPLFGAYPFPPESEGYSVNYYLNQLHPDLNDFIVFSEPGSIYTNGVLYLSLNGFTATDPNEAKIFLISSNDHGEIWNYEGILTNHDDAVNLGYNRLVASSLVEECGRMFLFAAPYSDFPIDHNGTYIFEFEDISQAKLKRDINGKLIAHKYLAPTLPDWTNAGESDYDEHNTYGGIMMPQTSTNTIELFQIFNTKEKVVDTYYINGFVTDSNNAGISDVLITLTGSINKSTITASNGYFQFFELPEGGNYTIIPIKTNYTFEPVSISTISLNSGLDEQNFTGIPSSVIVHDLENPKIYPNPSNLNNGHTQVNLTNLTDEATIKIYTISGRLVKTIQANGGNAIWYCKNESDKTVVSGLYIYVITNPEGEKKTGKIVVVR